MPGQTFDIESLLRFNPSRFLCEKCYALLGKVVGGISQGGGALECPVCMVKYMATDEIPLYQADRYFRFRGLHVEFKDVVEHSRDLAEVAASMRSNLQGNNPFGYVPMHALFAALNQAQHFVHFSTYGISHLLLGALKLTAQRIPVRGIVSGADEPVFRELTDYTDEAPQLNVKIYGRDGRPERWDATPHQKMVIIDGLLAFKGSANLTISGWRKAAIGRDVIEAVTEVEEVIKLNNRFFSPVWAEFSGVREIVMTDLPF